MINFLRFMRTNVLLRRAANFERVADELSGEGQHDAAVACMMMASATLAVVEAEKELASAGNVEQNTRTSQDGDGST